MTLTDEERAQYERIKARNAECARPRAAIVYLCEIIDRLVSSATPSAGDVRNEALEEAARAIEADPTCLGAKQIRALKTPPSKQGG